MGLPAGAGSAGAERIAMPEVALAGGLADRERLGDSTGLVADDEASLAGGKDVRRGPFTGVTGDGDAGQRAETQLGDPAPEANASAAVPPTVTVTVEPAATLRGALRPATFPAESTSSTT